MPNVYRKVQRATSRHGIPYRVVFSSRVPKALGKSGFTWLGTVRLAGDYYSASLRNHEEVHLWQEKRAGTIPYSVSYIWQLLTRGYRRISYEVEAERLTTAAAQSGTLPPPMEAWVWEP